MKRVFGPVCRECGLGWLESDGVTGACPICGASELYEATMYVCEICEAPVLPSFYAEHLRDHRNAKKAHEDN